MRKYGFLPLALVVGLAVLAYLNTLPNGFVWDDHFQIESNPAIVSSAQVPRYFTQDVYELTNRLFPSGTHYYRPLFWLSYFGDYQLWGLRPFGYHLTNILLHALCCGLLYLLFLEILGDPETALIGAALFALHPVHTETVAGLFSRHHLLGFAGAAGALLFYARAAASGPARKLDFALSLLCFAAALLSIETALLLPFLILAYDLCFPRPGGFRASKCAPFFAAAVVFFLIKKMVLGIPEIAFEYWGGSPRTNAFAALRVFGHYLSILAWPVGLSPSYYGMKIPSGLLEWPVPAALLALAGAMVFFGVASRKFPRAFFLCAWAGVTYLPVSGLVPLGMLAADRYLYFASAGFCGLLALGLGEIKSRFGPRVAVSGAVALGLVYFGLTVARNRAWKDDLTLWRNAAASHPDDALARLNHGRALFGAGRNADALEQLARVFDCANASSAERASSHAIRAVIYSREPDGLDRAVEEARAGLSLGPVPESLELELGYNLGSYLIKKGDLIGAQESYRAILANHPLEKRAWTLLAWVYAQKKDHANVALALEEALKIDPEDKVTAQNLAAARRQLGK